MMRVLTPNGNVIEVEKAEAIVEKRVSFNGRDIRLCQTAKDKSQPASGLYFSVKTESVFTIANEGNLLVGNLPVDTVKKIVTNLAKDGFCDLSGFDYQPEIGINDKPVFDEGKSRPYFCRSNVAMMFAPRQNMDFPINAISNTDTGVNSFPQSNTEETDIFNDDLWVDDSSDNDSCDDGFDNGEEN